MALTQVSVSSDVGSHHWSFCPGQLFCVPQGVVGVVGELPECCHCRPVLWIPGMGKAALQEQHLRVLKFP